jgi:hypothetical protein
VTSSWFFLSTSYFRCLNQQTDAMEDSQSSTAVDFLTNRKNSVRFRKGMFITVTSVYEPTNAHTISHKTLLKHFKTLRHVSQYSTSEAHLATAPQHIPTQHDMLPQHLVCKYELNCENCNITLARN